MPLAGLPYSKRIVIEREARIKISDFFRMNIYSLNINGLSEKHEELRVFLDDKTPDILFLQETKTRSTEFNDRIDHTGVLRILMII